MSGELRIGVLAGSADMVRRFVIDQPKHPRLQYVYIQGPESMRGIEFDAFILLDSFWRMDSRSEEDKHIMYDMAQMLLTQRFGQ